MSVRTHTPHLLWNHLGEQVQFTGERVLSPFVLLSDGTSAPFISPTAMLMLSSSLRRNAPNPLSFRRFINANANPTQLRFRYASPRPRPATLQTPEEIYIGKLLHLLHVGCLSDLLVVEEHP